MSASYFPDDIKYKIATESTQRYDPRRIEKLRRLCVSADDHRPGGFCHSDHIWKYCVWDLLADFLKEVEIDPNHKNLFLDQFKMHYVKQLQNKASNTRQEADIIKNDGRIWWQFAGCVYNAMSYRPDIWQLILEYGINKWGARASTFYAENNPNDHFPEKNDDLLHNLFILYLSAIRALQHVQKDSDKSTYIQCKVVHDIERGETEWARNLFVNLFADLDVNNCNFISAFVADRDLRQQLEPWDYALDADYFLKSMTFLKTLLQYHDAFRIALDDLTDAFSNLLENKVTDFLFYHTIAEFACKQWPDDAKKTLSLLEEQLEATDSRNNKSAYVAATDALDYIRTQHRY